MSEKEVLRELLEHELELLARTKRKFLYSLYKVQAIQMDTVLSEEEYEVFDSFSSRFLRLYEVLVNQVIRTVLTLVNERKTTYLDNMHIAEKLRLITSVQDIDVVRKLRNQVAHAYLDEEWISIYNDLIAFAPFLLRSSDMTRQYCDDLSKRI
jgi:hypothetical protein